jgi:hypothetical protein
MLYPERACRQEASTGPVTQLSTQGFGDREACNFIRDWRCERTSSTAPKDRLAAPPPANTHLPVILLSVWIRDDRFPLGPTVDTGQGRCACR